MEHTDCGYCELQRNLKFDQYIIYPSECVVLYHMLQWFESHHCSQNPGKGVVLPQYKRLAVVRAQGVMEVVTLMVEREAKAGNTMSAI